MLVLDASALLAYLLDEDGAEAVEKALLEGTIISAINLAEVLSKLSGYDASGKELMRRLHSHGLFGDAIRVEPFDESDAILVSGLRAKTQGSGLSLADRACLALAGKHKLSVLTADRLWTKFDLGVHVKLIR